LKQRFSRYHIPTDAVKNKREAIEKTITGPKYFKTKYPKRGAISPLKPVRETWTA